MILLLFFRFLRPGSGGILNSWRAKRRFAVKPGRRAKADPARTPRRVRVSLHPRAARRTPDQAAWVASAASGAGTVGGGGAGGGAPAAGAGGGGRWRRFSGRGGLFAGARIMIIWRPSMSGTRSTTPTPSCCTASTILSSARRANSGA
jgi:hypothetical protein